MCSNASIRTFSSSKSIASTDLWCEVGGGAGAGVRGRAAAAASRSAAVEKESQTESRGSCSYLSYRKYKIDPLQNYQSGSSGDDVQGC